MMSNHSLLMRTISPATLLCASLALPAMSVLGAEWPPTLDADPEIQPPKWDWQLAVPIKVNPDSSIKIYDIEMFENESSGAVDALHALGYKVICYVDVGSWENWRDDKELTHKPSNPLLING